MEKPSSGARVREKEGFKGGKDRNNVDFARSTDRPVEERRERDRQGIRKKKETEIFPSTQKGRRRNRRDREGSRSV